MFDSLSKLVGDVVDIAVAPIEIAVDVTSALVEPVAVAAKEVVESVKDVIDDR